MQAIAMIAQILQRHVSAMQSAPPGMQSVPQLLALDGAFADQQAVEPEQALPVPIPFPPDSEAVRQESVMRALFADPPIERGTALPTVASPPSLPPLPATLVRHRCACPVQAG